MEENIKLYEFERQTTGFSFVFAKNLEPKEVIIVKMPAISANKRGVNDIGWMANGDVTLLGTLAKNPKSEEALWQEIRDNDEVNKVTAAIKIKNNEDFWVRIEMRVILN